MKTTIISIALLMSGAAMAQTTQPDVDANKPATDYGTPATMHSHPAPATTLATPSASDATVQPSNAAPEKDARGISVISDPATVPAGFNGVTGTAVGGPLVDPATGTTADPVGDSYPPCTASVTDNCLQTYERGRSPQ